MAAHTQPYTPFSSSTDNNEAIHTAQGGFTGTDTGQRRTYRGVSLLHSETRQHTSTVPYHHLRASRWERATKGKIRRAILTSLHAKRRLDVTMVCPSRLCTFCVPFFVRGSSFRVCGSSAPTCTRETSLTPFFCTIPTIGRMPFAKGAVPSYLAVEHGAQPEVHILPASAKAEFFCVILRYHTSLLCTYTIIILPW